MYRLIHWVPYSGDKVARICLLILFLSCAPNAIQLATRYPQVDQIWEQEITKGRDGRSYVEESYCVLGGQKIDLVLQYLILEYDMDSNQITRAMKPYCFKWVDKDGNVYAQQFDLRQDGAIDAMTGDLQKLNKALDKLND